MEKGDLKIYVVIVLIIIGAVFITSSNNRKQAVRFSDTSENALDIPTGYPVRTVGERNKPVRTQKGLQPTQTLKQLYDAGEPASNDIARILIPNADLEIKDQPQKDEIQSLKVLFDAGKSTTDQLIINLLTGGKS